MCDSYNVNVSKTNLNKIDEINTLESKLSKLNELQNSGTINEEEYNNLRKKIIDKETEK